MFKVSSWSATLSLGTLVTMHLGLFTEIGLVSGEWIQKDGICGNEGMFNGIRNFFGETCSTKWIKNDLRDLEYQLRGNLFGQHLATKMIVKSIKGHLESSNPSKALALSFHGTTGIGKTYSSEMIVNALYREGMKSKFVKRFYGQTEFYDDTLVSDYRKRVGTEIENCVRECCQCLFIFEEIDKMPPGIFDSFKGYFDYYTAMHDIDYRRSIFIFISNVGSQRLEELMVSRWRENKPREDLVLNDVESYLREAVNTYGSLKNSVLITHDLLGTFIPFLPLEKEHVKLCLRRLAKSMPRGVDENTMVQVADNLSYFPEDLKRFAVTGCNSLREKLFQHDEL